MILVALALAAGVSDQPSPPVRAEPVEARAWSAAPATDPARARNESADAVDAVAKATGLAGEVLVAKGDKVILDRAYGTIAPTGGKPHKPGARWRLASITKQVTATIVMRMVARGDLQLDTPLGNTPQTAFLGDVTMRMLLQHHSGLANPDDTVAGPDGVPSFYKAKGPDAAFCASKTAKPDSEFHYNNCDYIVANEFLEQGEGAEGKLDNLLFLPGLRAALPGDHIVPGFVRQHAEPIYSVASFGASGYLTGTSRDVFGFDRALMTGKLLPPAALAELWKPEGGRSYQALGQWVFPGQLKRCAKPKRIVQRDGEIGGVQTRNFILPDDDLVVIVFINRSADDFPIGEIWQGKGFAYDLLSAAACS